MSVACPVVSGRIVIIIRVSLLNKKKYRVAIAYATLFYGFPRPKDKPTEQP